MSVKSLKTQIEVGFLGDNPELQINQIKVGLLKEAAIKTVFFTWPGHYEGMGMAIC